MLFRLHEPMRAWWFPATLLLFMALCGVVALLILVNDPLPALIGTGIVLCGLPLSRLFRSPMSGFPLSPEQSRSASQ